MPNNDVSIEPVVLYYGQKAVASAKESLNDLSLDIGSMDPIVVSSDVELSTIGLIDETKNLINSTNQDFEEVEEKITNVINGMKELDPMIAMLFDYYDEQDITLDELLSDVPEEVNEARSIAEMQKDAFAEVDYYDQYIDENSPKLAELHKRISTIESSIANIEYQKATVPWPDDQYAAFDSQIADYNNELGPLTEEYAALLQDLMLIKQFRNFAFENAYSMYTQYDDFEEKAKPRAAKLGEQIYTETQYDGTVGAPYEVSHTCAICYDEKGNVINSSMEIALYHYANPDEKIKWGCENKNDIIKIEENTLAYLTDDERKIIMYLYNTGNQKRLDDYLKYMEDKANQRHGEELAKEVTSIIDGYYADVGKSIYDEGLGDYYTFTEEAAFGNTMMELAFVGFGDGVTTFFAGLDNLANADGIMSAEEYKTQYLMHYLQGKYGEEGFKRILATGSYEISSSIGNMVPSVVVSAIPGCQLAGLTLMFLSATGNAREQALQQGLDEGGAWLYGILSGLSEAGLEYLLGGITKLASGKTPEAIAKGLGIPKLFAEMLSEGNEESLQSILDPLFLTIASRGEIPYEVDWNEVLKSGIYGMITAGLMNTGGAGIEFIFNGTTYSITNEQAELLKEGFKDKNLTNAEIQKQLETELAKMDPHAAANLELKRSILESVKDIDDPIALARALYLKLNENVHYDYTYHFGSSQMVLEELRSRELSFANLKENHNLVCMEWAALYKELLLSAGFTEDQVQIKGGGHQWVTIKTKDGVIIADATENIGGFGIDLEHTKVREATVGFVYVDSEFENIRLERARGNYRYSDVIGDSSYQAWLLALDQSIGYAGKNGYLDTQIGKANSIFANSEMFQKLFGKSKTQRIEEILSEKLPDTLSGLEAKQYYERVLSNNGLYADIHWDILWVKNDEGWIESVYALKYTDENGNNKCFLYSQSIEQTIMSEAEYELLRQESFDVVRKWDDLYGN